MAPFKLRFRMGSGSSRSASQEQDVVVDSQANQIVPNFQSNSNTLGGAFGSTTTLDSEQNNDSLVSMSNDQRALLRDRDTPDERIGKSRRITVSNCCIIHSPGNYHSLCVCGFGTRNCKIFTYDFQSILGYVNPTLTHTESTIPLSPPPSYEHVLEEVSSSISWL